MKRLLGFIFSIIVSFSLFSCAKSENINSSDTPKETSLIPATSSNVPIETVKEKIVYDKDEFTIDKEYSIIVAISDYYESYDMENIEVEGATLAEKRIVQVNAQNSYAEGLISSEKLQEINKEYSTLYSTIKNQVIDNEKEFLINSGAKNLYEIYDFIYCVDVNKDFLTKLENGKCTYYIYPFPSNDGTVYDIKDYYGSYIMEKPIYNFLVFSSSKAWVVFDGEYLNPAYFDILENETYEIMELDRSKENWFGFKDMRPRGYMFISSESRLLELLSLDFTAYKNTTGDIIFITKKGVYAYVNKLGEIIKFKLIEEN